VADKTVFLFTKKFPFGHQETYLFNELPYLIKEFTKVVIVPYDEFEYKPEHNRIKEEGNLEILRVNKIHNTLSLSQKTAREKAALSIMLFELFKGREPGNHFKYRKRNFSQLRHSYNNAISLKNYILKNSLNDIVLYNYWLHGGIVISGMLNKLLDHKYPVVSRAHAYDVYHKDWYSIYPSSQYLFLGFETWKVNHTDKIYPISTHAYNHFIKLFPGLKSKFEIARLGVPEQERPNAVGNPDVLTLVSCSNIDENKRIYRIPEVLSLMNKKVKWFHFGKGKPEDVEKVENEISRYSLKGSCRLMGFVPNAEVIQFYRTHHIDLFINLSQIEGIPVSLMEAASFGIPMLATKTVGNPEIVDDENGFLVGVNFDAKQIADRLNTYFEDESAILKKRVASRQTFVQKYNASLNYPEFINKIKNVTYASN
jgi:colanic acid/amylovoran biosynthesis glycosyltransferase